MASRACEYNEVIDFGYLLGNSANSDYSLDLYEKHERECIA